MTDGSLWSFRFPRGEKLCHDWCFRNRKSTWLSLNNHAEDCSVLAELLKEYHIGDTDATGDLTEGHTKRVVVASDGINTSSILPGGVLVHMPVVSSGLHKEVGKGGREEVG